MTAPSVVNTVECYLASDDKYYRKRNRFPESPPLTINVDKWFETSISSHLLNETHLPANTAAEMLLEQRKEDRSNGNHPLGCKANLVALNRNNNNNNNNNNNIVEDVNMLDSSDDDSEVELDYEMSDEEYDLYCHNELFAEYNTPPTPKRVHNPYLAPITLLICNAIQGQAVERPLQ